MAISTKFPIGGGNPLKKAKSRNGTIRKSTILNLVFLLCFFPFLKLIPWITPEVQPWGALLALFCLLTFGVNKDTVSSLVMIFLLLLASAAAVSFLIGRAPGSVVMLSGAYALPLFILLALKDNTHLLSVRVLYASLLLYLLVGILQSFSLLVWAEPYVKHWIPRFYGAPVGLAGRGVTFLAHEPSGAGFIITLMMATASYFYVLDKISGRALATVILTVLAMLVMNKSGTAFLLLLIFFSVFLLTMFWYGSTASKTKTLFLVLPIASLTALVAMLVIRDYAGSARYILLLHKLVDFASSAKLSTYAGLAEVTGGRFLSVFMGYASLIDGFGLGHGIAAYQLEYARLSSLLDIHWAEYSIARLFVMGQAQKPNAYAAQIALDLGVAGFLIIVLIVLFCWRQRGKRGFWSGERRFNKSLIVAVFATATFIIFVRSTTTMPIAWVMLAYVHDFIKSGIRR